MQEFKNLKECLSYFSEEKTCLSYLEQQLWNGKPVCPHCGSEKVSRLANGKQFKCGNKKTCDRKFTVLKGTIYENTKIPLSTWFGALWLLTSHKKGISSHQLARLLGLTQKSGWFVMHRIRLIMGDNSPENDLEAVGILQFTSVVSCAEFFAISEEKSGHQIGAA